MAILHRPISRSDGSTAETRMAGLRPVLIAAGVLIVVISVVQLVQTSRATTASFKIEELEEQKLQLQTAVSQLEVEVAGLSSLARIQQEAKRLGLGPPVARESVEVSVPGPSGDSAQLPARALPADDKQSQAEEQDSSVWDGLLERLPFN
jgi:cell division protein FtsL